jgi:glycosyltransferase involved in cell wall biosynthesis
MPLDVLHILGSAAPEGTGIARLVATLAAGLPPRGYRVHAWFLGADGPLASEVARSGARVRALNWRAGAADAASAFRLWPSLRDQRFTIVHQHAGGRSVRWLARAATSAAVVVHVHGRVLEATGSPLPAIGSSEADAVIATSRAVAAGLSHPGTRVVYPGVPFSEGSNGTGAAGLPATVVVGAAGRLVRLKGYLDLLRAALLLRPAHPDVRVEIAGDGPERPELEREARRLGLEHHIRFLGWQADLRASMRRWQIFAQPSVEEGFGIAALEAMAAGLPVLATRVGGLPELVEDDVTGILLPPGDPPALAHALARLLGNPATRRAMGNAARERARTHFSPDRMVEATAAIYDGIAGHRSAS